MDNEKQKLWKMEKYTNRKWQIEKWKMKMEMENEK